MKGAWSFKAAGPNSYSGNAMVIAASTFAEENNNTVPGGGGCSTFGFGFVILALAISSALIKKGGRL